MLILPLFSLSGRGESLSFKIYIYILNKYHWFI